MFAVDSNEKLQPQSPSNAQLVEQLNLIENMSVTSA